MSTIPNNQDVEKTVQLMVDHYKVPEPIIKGLFGKDTFLKLNMLLSNLGRNELNTQELVKMLILERGAYLFSGSNDEVRKLREYLLRQIPTESLVDLYNRNPAQGKDISSPSYMIKPLVQKKWIVGGSWPRDFVKALGFPIILSGISIPKTNKTEAVEDVQARKKVPNLVDFQLEIKEKMLNVLNLKGDKTRCVVTLPTGGGKTRVAVESFIEWMQVRFSEGKYLIWIAQSEELCEQAITCIADMWQEKEFPESLRIYRYFAGKKVSEDQLIGGVVVASIQQLYSRLQNEDKVFEEFIKDCGAMIIDEAHHAIAPIYSKLLQKAEEIHGKELFPICGLTATPGRSNDETVDLVNQFQAYLIKPELPYERQYEENPLLYFREQGYLAKPIHIIHQSGIEYEIREEEIDIQNEDFHIDFLEVLANDERRNYEIIKKLLSIPAGKATLVYACTVSHAEFLTSVMNASGRKAACISANTTKDTRRMYIDAFKKGDLEFLFNYGVLTTGFDAPKTEYIVICRPTTSVILYEQIVGRGLRGPKFGGTETCTIIDFADNLPRLGRPLAYQRFNHFWELETIK
ncbi:DEAD/DEAH box helicase [Bacillus sp. BGMRC 2118]|nr:DEAD/DEAH box helicase [Bacillus sp. BGMRC 2118]